MLRVAAWLLIVSGAAALNLHTTLPTLLPQTRIVTRRAAVVRANAPEQKVEEKEEEETATGAGGPSGHSVPKSQAPAMSEEEMAIQKAVMAHQKDAARLSNAEECRSLVQYATGFATLSTMSKTLPGFPSGSVVGFAIDDDGLPVFCFSTMSSHTQDLLEERNGAPATLTVTAKDFKGAADGRLSLMGKVSLVKEGIDDLRTLYKQTHPNAFWVDFGDFLWFRMTELKAVRYVGGFARAGSVTPEEYKAAEPDPIMAFAAPVMGHMNDDHSGSTVAMVEHWIGLPGVEQATLVGLDRLGMTVQCQRLGQTFKLRLPFTRAAKDRKDVKTLIVELTQAAAKAGKSVE